MATPFEIAAAEQEKKEKIEAALAKIQDYRSAEGAAVKAAQLSEPIADASWNPDGHQVVAGHWEDAYEQAHLAHLLALETCTGLTGCWDVLDAPMGPWKKRAEERAVAYKKFAETESALQQRARAGARTPVPPPPYVIVVPGGTSRPPTPGESGGETSVNLGTILIAGLALLVGWKVLK